MRSVSLRLVDLERNPLIPLGFEGENEYTTVRVDCKKIFDEHPDAVPALAVTPPEGDSYPAVIVRDGDIVSWTVTDSDLVHPGAGELQLTFVDGTIIGKTYKARTKVLDSITPSGEAPTPIQNWLIQAAAALQALPTEVASSVAALMGAMVGVGETLDPDDNVTVNYDPVHNTLTIGVPHGRDGEDGHTPAITANKVGKVATFYVDGVAIVQISDGQDADPTVLIDDTSTAQNRTWSAKKLDEEKQSLKTQITKAQGDVSDLKTEINNNIGTSSLGWEIGSLNPGYGTELTSATRIRSDYIEVTKNTIISLSGNENCLIVYLFSKNDTTGYISDSAWNGGNKFVVSNSNAKYARILIRKSSSNDTLTSDDIPTQVARLTVSMAFPSDTYTLSKRMKTAEDIEQGLLSVANQYAMQPIESKTVTLKNGYYKNDGFHSSNSFECAEYACSGGEKVLLTASGNSSYAGYFFFDSNGVCLQESTKDVLFTNSLATVPAGATLLALNKLNGAGGQASELGVKAAKTNDPFVITDINNILKHGMGWHELVEVDNLSGAWTNTTNYVKNGTTITGYVTKIYDVSDISMVRFTGTAYRIYLEDANGTKTVYSLAYPVSNEAINTVGFVKVIVCGLAENFSGSGRAILEGYTKITSKWENRKMVWFGTSIPAGGFKGEDNPASYPFLVGRLLGATVYNEAVGDSGVHYRELSRVSATNPYGFNFYFVSATRCLTNTIAMMQWLGNWADYYCNGGTYKNAEEWDSTIFTSGLPNSWTDADTEAIKQFSYENKLDKYLTDGTFPDLFVFDHGYNDRIRWADNTGAYEAQLAEYGRDNCYTFRGAMNFLIDRILSFNPWAKIIMIGDYENQSDEKKYDSTYQMRVAEDYEIPIFKRWEYTGWSQVQETAHYNWSSGLLNYTENSTNAKSILAWNLADGVHPHSDKTGRANRIMARLIAPFIDKLN